MNIAELCVKRPIFAVMLISFLLVLGIFSYRDLGVDLFPKADPPVVTVNVRLSGATPEEINTQIILPLEEAISSVSGLDELNTQANEGSARLTCRFNLERDIESAAQDIREKVAAATKNLPTNIDPPVITKADPDSDPVLAMLVSGPGDLRETTEVADKQIKRVLETVNGVGAVALSGGRERQIRVFLDAEKLNAYGITINQVESAIQGENVEVPGGTMRRGSSELGVRTLGRIEASSQFAEVVLTTVNGAPIRVKDVGRVEDSYPDVTSWNLLHGREAVVLNLQRQSGTNTLEVVQTAKEKLDQIKKSLPPGFKVEVIRDSSTFIEASVASLKEHLLWGSLLASLVVLLFIRSFRSVIIAALAIPTSVIATFTLLKAMDFTLNNMTLLGLTLAVGIVIDDAIVVLENIVRYIEEKGYEPKQAAIEATKEIMLAVIATTLSLVIIFVPIAFTTGYARRYVNQFGWTMAFAVMVSMLVSFTLTPMLCSRLLRKAAGKKDLPTGSKPDVHSSKDGKVYQWVDRKYGNMLNWALNHRMVVVLIALGTFALTFPLNKLVGRDFIPADDQSEFQVIIDSPVGMSLEGTAAIMTDLSSRFEKVRGVIFAWPNIGERANHSHCYIKLIDVSKRNYSVTDVTNDFRKILAEPQYRNLRPKYWIPSALGGGENTGALQPVILGPDFYRATEIATKKVEEVRKIKGLVDVSAEVNINVPELQVTIDRQRASDLGVRAADVAKSVRLMIAGTDQVTSFKEGDEQYDVTMQLLPEQQRDPAVLARLMIPSAKVGQVRLDNIASVQRGVGPTKIERNNRNFGVSVTAMNDDSLPMDQAVKAVTTVMKKDLPSGYSLRFTGTARELDRTMSDLFTALMLAAIFMYMVLAAQFESLLHPLTIMLSLPLAIPMALLTLYLTHRTLNLWSALGIFLLIGIVKKNGILQVDYTNRLRAEGMPLREAIIQANHVRLRPILMTTLAIIAGLIPTATGIGAGAAQRSAIAMTIIGGQTLCLVLSLLITPVAYYSFARLEEKRGVSTHGGFSRIRMAVSRVFTLMVR